MNKETKLIIYPAAVFMILIFILLHPNQLLHYSQYTVYGIKYPLLTIITFILLLNFIQRPLIKPFVIVSALLFFIAMNYTVINSSIFSSYIYRSVLFFLFCVFFYRYPNFINLFASVFIVLSAIFSLQAIFYTIAWLLDYKLQYEYINFIDYNKFRNFNLFVGFENDYNYFRVSSYFTETNRFAYFLTPSLFLSYHFRRINVIYYGIFLVIAWAMIMTFSAFAFFAIIFTSALYIYDRKGKSHHLRHFAYIKIILVMLAFSLVFFVVYNKSPEYWGRIVDKTSSFKTRINGVQDVLAIVSKHKFGVPSSFDSKSIDGVKGDAVTQPILYWVKHGGVQTIVPLIILLLLWIKYTRIMMKSADPLYRALGYGIFAYFLEQSFYGTYFEYLFLLFMAFVTVYAFISKRNRVVFNRRCTPEN